MKIDREDLQRTFERFDMPEPALDRLVGRRERRRRNERIRAGITALVVVALAVAFVSRSFLRTQPAANKRVPAPTWQTADVDGTVFTNPGGWHLVGYFKGSAQEVTLANFAPDLTSTDPCAAMPAEGTVLAINPQARESQQPAWPVDLANDDSTSQLACDGEHLHASWSVGGHTYEAEATLGVQVSDADRAALLRAFADLTFPSKAFATNSSSSCFVADEGFHQMVGEVVGAQTTGGIAWTMYATTASRCAPHGGIAVAAVDEGYGFVGPIPPNVPAPGLNVQDSKVGNHSYVAGIVGTDVARIELQMNDGGSIEAPIVPAGPLFPESQAYFVAFDGYPAGTIVSYDPAGNELQRSGFRAGMDCEDYADACNGDVRPNETIAAGVDPAAPYRLVEHDGAIELRDQNGRVVTSVSIGSGGLTLASAPVGHGKSVIFGSAPPATVLMFQKLSVVGWGLVQSTRLRDGTIVYWSEWTTGEVSKIAAFDGTCHALAAADARTGASTLAPGQSHCIGSNG